MTREDINLLLGILFVVGWFLAAKISSIQSGWALLAKEFRFKGRFIGEIFRCQRVAGGNSTHIGLNNEGLYLAPIFVFRTFHKPLFIPWKKVKFVFGRQFFSLGYYITIDGYEKPKFFMPKSTYEKIEDYIPIESKSTSERIKKDS